VAPFKQAVMAMDEFHKKAAITALKKMFDGRYFDICTVDNVIKITGCIADRKDYQALRALHCVNWSDMDADLRNMVMVKTMQIFDTPKFSVEVLSNAIKNDSLLLN
jgi:hypothetical protein